MAEKILNTRILMKVDTLEAWSSSTLKIKEGELCLATVAATAGTGLEEPVVMMKVGTAEEKTFAELPWAFHAKASDVLAACKTEAGLTAFVNGVIADAGIATDEAMQALAGRVTTAEGEIDALQTELNTAGTGLKARMTAAEGAIDALELLVGDTAVATQISDAITKLNLETTYAAKVHGHEIADVNGLADSIAAAKKAGTDANAALETYKTTNDAAVKVNSDAIAGIKNGETIDNFKEVEEALAGKQAVGDYATKTEAQGYANAKDAAIQAAKKAGDDAQDAVDALAGKVGTVAEGKTVVGMIADAQTAATYDDTEVKKDIADLEGLVGETSVATQIDNKVAALNLPNTYDAKGAAATAESNAKAHADSLNTAMNTRVEALEAIDHDHSNKTVLDGITAEKVAAWDAAEGNAKAHATALDTAMDIRVDALEAKFTGEGSVADQIADAVAAEAKLREDADKELAADIKAITDDYLKAADKTALQEQITANDGEIAALQGLVGDKKVSEAISTAVDAEATIARAAEKANADAIAAVKEDVDAFFKDADMTESAKDTLKELQAYIASDESGASQMAASIKANADAIDAIEADYLKAANKTELEGKITAAQNAADKAQGEVDTLEGVVATKAAQADLETLSGKVTTAEGKITTLEGEMDAVEGRATALEGKVGDKTVSEQITAVTNPLAERVVALEAIDHEHANKTVLDGVTAEKVAAWDKVSEKANDADLAAIAKSGNVNDLVQTAGDVLIFDCGNATV